MRKQSILLGFGSLVIAGATLAGSGIINVSFTRSEALAVDAVPVPEFRYGFDGTSTVNETASADSSSNPEWWLRSGGRLVISGGFGSTLKGKLASTDSLRSVYLAKAKVASDNGFRPQNIFQLLTRKAWENSDQRSYFRITDDTIFNPSNVNATHGVSLVSRYADQNNHYSTGLRMNGTAYIKKTRNGSSSILAQASFFGGTYDRLKSPDLLPKGTFIGLRTVTATQPDGSVTIDLYVDSDRSGNWKLAARAVDQKYSTGGPVYGAGKSGIQSDFIEMDIDSFDVASLGGATAAVAPTAATTTSQSSTNSPAPATTTTSTPTTQTATQPTATTTSTVSPAPAPAPAPTSTTTTPAPAPAPAPAPTVASSGNPLSGIKFYVDPNSNAKRQADMWRSSRPADAAQMDKIAGTSAARWLGNWNSNVQSDVSNAVNAITSTGATPVFVLYNIPQRDCGQWSAGGASGGDAYKSWIQSVANGTGGKRAVFILEPDAVAGITCLSETDKQHRNELLSYAITTLKQKNAVVYLDAGHAKWVPADEIAQRLKAAGLDKADGFSLNVSNYVTSGDNVSYGEQVSRATGGKHFVIDTSRNGLGPNGEWCNPSGRALGAKPTASTGNSLLDAYMWIKAPGESDGGCNGGPSAGVWWPEYALGLAQRANY